MRIAYVLTEDISFHGTSGASAHVRNVVEQLENRGHSVELISRVSRSGSEPERSSASSGKGLRDVASAVLPSTIKTAAKDWWTRRKNRRLIQQNRDVLEWADVIYERDAYQSFGTQSAVEETGTPWVLECNGLFGHSTFHHPAAPALYKWRHVKKWKKADRIIAVSHQLKRELVSHGVQGTKISVVHNGVDMAPYSAVDEEDRRELRRKMNLRDRIVVGFVGHILPKHNVGFIIETIDRLSDKYPVQALIVGGARWTQYQQEAHSRSLQEQITFTGPVPPEEVPVYTSSMDICTLPGCHLTDSPVKLFDYGAAGKPVVAPDMLNVREIIEDDTNGLLFAPEDSGNFRVCVEGLLNDATLRERLGRELHNTVNKNHTWDRVGAQTEDIMQSIR